MNEWTQRRSLEGTLDHLATVRQRIITTLAQTADDGAFCAKLDSEQPRSKRGM